MTKEKPELTKDERWCEKCKRVVPKGEFNSYYGICKDCVKY